MTKMNKDKDIIETIDLTDDISQTKPNSRLLINGIDPGSVNCGISTYNATTDQVHKLQRISFRNKIVKGPDGKKKASDTDLGHAKLVEQVAQYFVANPEFFRNITFIENQFSDDINSDRRDAHKSEGRAVQLAFQTLLGENCIPVAPHAVKQHFSDYFPKVTGIDHLSLSEQRNKQYYADKRNAKINGRLFTPSAVRIPYEKENPTKKDDGYDAFWIAKYGYECKYKEKEKEKEKKKPKKKQDNKRPRRRNPDKIQNVKEGEKRKQHNVKKRPRFLTLEEEEEREKKFDGDTGILTEQEQKQKQKKKKKVNNNNDDNDNDNDN